MTTARIFIDTNALRANRKDNGCRPTITTDAEDGRHQTHGVSIYGPDGSEVARLAYEPDDPWSGTAEVWVEVLDGSTVKFR